jgi:hypothetical protein
MDPALLTAIRLSREGFGTPQEILHMPADVVLAALEFVTFQDEYEATVRELNRKD